MMITEDPRLLGLVGSHPHPLLFATISGAHLYGFPSPDSDVDLRGVHLLPLEQIVGLIPGAETIERSSQEHGLDADVVTHDLKKFIGLMLRPNGYVLEQLFSPLIVQSGPEHEELKKLAPSCITRRHVHHYRGFARTQEKLIQKEDPPRIKPILYMYRVLLTGIHLMRSGEVEANLVKLNESARLGQLVELIQMKLTGGEGVRLQSGDMELHRREFERLRQELDRAAEASFLPEAPGAVDALNDLLVRTRLARR